MFIKKRWRKIKLLARSVRELFRELSEEEACTHTHDYTLADALDDTHDYTLTDIHDYTLGTYIEIMTHKLETDAVGLWQCIPYLRQELGLIGTALIDSTRELLLALLKEGAEPVVAAEAGNYGWRLVNYGKTTEEKVESILQEWLGAREDPSFWNSIWFTLPQYITELQEVENIKVTNPTKPYPGKVYVLPGESGHFGIRMNNQGEKIIEFSHMTDYPTYMQFSLSKYPFLHPPMFP